MEIIRLGTAAQSAQAFSCVAEAPSAFWAEGTPLARGWVAANLGRGMEGLQLAGDDGVPLAHVYWAMSGQAIVPYRAEPGVACLYCEWVQTAHQGRGYMRRLFDALVAALQAEGVYGILAIGTDEDEYMHTRHFVRRGFRPVLDLHAGHVLYLPLSRAQVEVEPLQPRLPVPAAGDPVQVLIVGMHACPVGASAVLAVRRVAAEFGPRVELVEVPAGPQSMAEYGVADGIFIDGRPIFFGPMADEQVRQHVSTAVRDHAS